MYVEVSTCDVFDCVKWVSVNGNAAGSALVGTGNGAEWSGLLGNGNGAEWSGLLGNGNGAECMRRENIIIQKCSKVKARECKEWVGWGVITGNLVIMSVEIKINVVEQAKAKTH